MVNLIVPAYILDKAPSQRLIRGPEGTEYYPDEYGTFAADDSNVPFLLNKGCTLAPVYPEPEEAPKKRTRAVAAEEVQESDLSELHAPEQPVGGDETLPTG